MTSLKSSILDSLSLLPYWKFKTGTTVYSNANSRACGLLDRALMALNTINKDLSKFNQNKKQIIMSKGAAIEDLSLLNCGSSICPVINYHMTLIFKLQKQVTNINNQSDLVPIGNEIHRLAKMILNTQKYIYSWGDNAPKLNHNYKPIN